MLNRLEGRELEEFEQECAALLELAREIAVKYNRYIDIVAFGDGKGFANGHGGLDLNIGYREPFDKAVNRPI